MQTVRTLTSEVNDTPETVLNWAAQKAARYEIPGTTARLWANAMRQFVALLDDTDPKDPKSLLENATEICRRYSLKTQGNPETAKSYESRVRSCVSNYLAWKADPSGWRYREKEKKAKASSDAKVAKKKPAGENPAEPVASVPAAEAAQPEPDNAPLPRGASGEEMRTYPLGESGVFAFVLPEGGITSFEAYKIAMHIATFAKDYDPSGKTHDTLRALVLDK